MTGEHIDSARLDSTIASNIANKTGAQVTVDCPANQPARGGYQFLCPISQDGTVIGDARVSVPPRTL